MLSSYQKNKLDFRGNLGKEWKAKQENGVRALNTVYRSCPLVPEVYGRTEKDLKKGIWSDQSRVAVSIPRKVKWSGFF